MPVHTRPETPRRGLPARLRRALALAVLPLVGVLAAHGCVPARAPTAPPDSGLDGSSAITRSDADTGAASAPDATDADTEASVTDAANANAEAGRQRAAQGPCPEGMAHLGERVCIDRWEAALVVVAQDGSVRPHPHNLPPSETEDVRAISQPGVWPQTYISALQAEDACSAADKRLCTQAEWGRACEGVGRLAYPYAAQRTAGVCNDNGRSAVGVVFPGALLAQGAAAQGGHGGASPARSKGRGRPPAKAVRGRKAKPTPGHAKTGPTSGKKRRRPSGPTPGVDPSVWTRLNDPRLGEVEGTFARTGERAQCTNELEVYDLVGNAHEWLADELPNGNGVFAGGYYLDVQINGEGCHYRTMAHARSYHDYSTGFRCCKDLPGD